MSQIDEHLAQLFRQTALSIELEDFMRGVVPPENPFWGNQEDQSFGSEDDKR